MAQKKVEKKMVKKKVSNKNQSKKRVPNKKQSKKKQRHTGKLIVGSLLLIVAAVTIWNVIKPMPTGLSKRSEMSRTNHAELLLDNTYADHYDHEIFNTVFKTIDEADDFIILDMFLFNDAYDGAGQFPDLAGELTRHLVNKKKDNPNVRIYVLTDPINSVYGSYTPEQYKQLRANDIFLYETDLTKLRDSNPIYSGLWRSTFRFLGNSENGHITNIFSRKAPDVTIRGMAELLNFKANHRKTVVTEKSAIIASSNPHNPSSHHQNVAVKLSGRIQEDIINSEIAAINMSGGGLDKRDFHIKNHAFDNTMAYGTTLVTEGKIKEALLEAIDKTNDNDTMKIGMFYLSDRDVIDALLRASDRGVDIKLILDVNKEAFGKEKPGIPNKPVAHELVSKSNDRIQVKWAVSHGEQFHNKYVLIEDDQQGESTLFVGSANLTRRNIDDNNMETDVILTGKSHLPVFSRLNQDFDDKWENRKGHVTDSYDVQKEVSFWKTVVYRLQEFTGLSSF
ncbi:phospholipase D [Macrococcus hajekii]|nr:phospholipase D family protein [Macrococcus hajekii]GGB01049.1 phospholipase D [Macrococcus hajekii]